MQLPMMSPSLTSLPAEIISKIISFLGKADLIIVCQVCKHLYYLCVDEPVWMTIKGQAVNFRPEHFRQLRKSQMLPRNGISSKNSLKEACRIAHNWRYHSPKDFNLRRFKQKLLPWLYLDDHTLYVSQASGILVAKVGSGRQMRQEFTSGQRVYRGHTEDVVKFAVTESQVISGGRDERILVWDKDRPYTPIQDVRVPGAVTSLDACSTSIVAGIRGQGVVVLGKDGTHYESRYTLPFEDIVWTVALNPNQRCFTAGSSCHRELHPLNVFDLERGTNILSCGSGYRRGAGITSLHYQDAFTFLSSGYDCSLNCWDLRDSCRIPALAFPDEDQTFSYSMDSDMNNFIACGLCRFGQIKFWDKRWPSSGIQSFFVGNVGDLRRSSPVYSLKLSPTHLYAALSQSLQCMDFTGKLCWPPPR